MLVAADATLIESFDKVNPSLISGELRRAAGKYGAGILVKEGTINLIPNPSFEVDSSYWNGVNGAGVVKTDGGYVGDRYYRWTASGAGVAGAYCLGVYVRPSQAYTFSIFVRPSVTLSINTNIEWYTTGGTLISTSTATKSCPANQWTRVTVTATSPVNVNSVHLTAFSTSAPVNGTTIDYDAAQLEAQGYPTEYTDGSRGTGYSWDTQANLITNPSFEADTSGWTGVGENLLSADDSSFEATRGTWVVATNCTIARSTTKALVGTASLAITSVAAGAMSAKTALNAYQVAPGRVYTVVGSFLANTTPRQVRMELYWIQADGSTIISNPVGVYGADNPQGWTQVTLTAQAPANAVYAAVQFTVATTAAGEVHYLDTVGLFFDPTGNLIGNSDFESGLGVWTSSGSYINAGSTLTVDSTRAYTGKYSLAIATTASPNQQGATTNGITTTVIGSKYTASVWAYSVAATSLDIVIGGTAGQDITSSTVALSAGVWTRLTATLTATAAYSLAVSIRRTTNAVSTFWVDAPRLEIGATASTYVPPVYGNLVTNPSFETDLSGWSAVGGSAPTVTRSTAQAFAGTASARIAWVTGSSGSNAGFTTTVVFVQSGQTYTYSAYVFIPTGSTRIGITAYGAPLTGSVRSSESSLFDQWQRLSVSFTATGTGYATLQVDINNGLYTAVAGAIAYFDCVQCELGTVANPYVDGAQGSGYSWDVSQNFLSAQDASFEAAGVGTWTVGSNCTLSNSTAQAFNGTHSLAITSVAAGTMSAAQLSYTVAPNTVYTVTAAVRAATVGRTGQLQINFYDASHTFISQPANIFFTDVTTAFTQINATALSPSNAAFIGIFIQFNSTAAAGEVHYADAIQLEQRNYNTPFNQNGTANAATSNVKSPWSLLGQIPITRTGTAADGTQAGYTGESNPNLFAQGLSYKITLAASTTYTFSAYVRHLGAYLMVDGPGVTAAASSATSDNGGAFIRLYLTFTTTSAGGTVYLRALAPPDGVGFLVDAVKLEKNGYPTPYGSTGANQTSSSRVGDQIRFTPTYPTRLFPVSTFAVVRVGDPSTIAVFLDLGKADVSNLFRIQVFMTGTANLRLFDNGSNIGGPSVNLGTLLSGDLVVVAGTYDGTTAVVYAQKNGGTILTASSAIAVTNNSAPDILSFGYNQYDGIEQTDSVYDQVLVCDSVLTSAEVTALANSGTRPDLNSNTKIVAALDVDNLQFDLLSTTGELKRTITRLPVTLEQPSSTVFNSHPPQLEFTTTTAVLNEQDRIYVQGYTDEFEISTLTDDISGVTRYLAVPV